MGAPAVGSVLGGSLASVFGPSLTSYAYATGCLGLVALLGLRYVTRRQVQGDRDPRDSGDPPNASGYTGGSAGEKRPGGIER